MPSSWVRPDNSRAVGNTTRYLLRRLLTWALDRPKAAMALWAGLLLFAIITELLPGDSAPVRAVSVVNDKFIHFSVYAAVAFAPAFGLRLHAALVCILTTEMVGIGLEFAQLFVPQRSCDYYDIAANTAGVLAGAGLALLCRLLALSS